MRDILSRFAGATPQAFGPGERLIEEGRQTGRLFVLKSGTLEVRRRGVVVAQIAEPGAVLGEISLLLERPHTATVVAVTPVEAFEFHGGLPALEAQPGLPLHIALLLAQRLAHSTALLGELRTSAAGQPKRRSLLERLATLLTGQPAGGRGPRS